MDYFGFDVYMYLVNFFFLGQQSPVCEYTPRTIHPDPQGHSPNL